MPENLISVLINASEKAANIARICRADKNLFSLLVQEKTSSEANPRFVKDFKTLADVLIQETIRNDVTQIFPELEHNINGEETANFTNSLGNSITVGVQKSQEETAEVLEVVLDSNRLAANVLAEEAHKVMKYPNDVGDVPELPVDFSYTNVGIWIDPIDATAEYIQGETVFSNFPGITSSGLDCVTVLIGVFDKQTGIPIIGVVNQPFHHKTDDNSYVSKVYWGICCGNIRANNIAELELKPKTLNKVGVFSSSENEQVLEKMKNLDYEVAYSAGAGHKALKVITGEADLYLLSKGSTYKWDTCAPQAILASLNGGMFDFRKSLSAGELIPVSYNEDDEKCNSGGILAVRDRQLLKAVVDVLK